MVGLRPRIILIRRKRPNARRVVTVRLSICKAAFEVMPKSLGPTTSFISHSSPRHSRATSRTPQVKKILATYFKPETTVSVEALEWGIIPYTVTYPENLYTFERTEASSSCALFL